MQLVDECMKFFEISAQRCRCFFICGGSAEFLAKFGIHTLEILALLAERSRRPIQIPQAVEDCAPDADFRVRLELDAALRFKLVDGVQQSQDSSIDQIV